VGRTGINSRATDSLMLPLNGFIGVIWNPATFMDSGEPNLSMLLAAFELIEIYSFFYGDAGSFLNIFM